MKKTLAIFLALITILSIALVACKDKTPAAVGGDEEEDDPYVSQNNIPAGSDTSDTSDTTGGGEAGWTEKTGTVYLMADGVNVRSQATSGNNVLTYNNKIGTSYEFTAVNSKWYKIIYNNAEAYISADFVTENAADADFDTKKLTTPEALVMEDAPEGYSDKGYQVVLRVNASLTGNNGDKYIYKADITEEKPLKKIAENASGNIWQVEYEGGTYYMGSGSYKYFDGKPNSTVGGQG